MSARVMSTFSRRHHVSTLIKMLGIRGTGDRPVKTKIRKLRDFQLPLFSFSMPFNYACCNACSINGMRLSRHVHVT